LAGVRNWAASIIVADLSTASTCSTRSASRAVQSASTHTGQSIDVADTSDEAIFPVGNDMNTALGIAGTLTGAGVI
jgi:hypothetical protein